MKKKIDFFLSLKMKQEIARNLTQSFEDLFDKLNKFDKFFNNDRTSSEINDCKIHFEQVLIKVISSKTILDAEKNLDQLADYTLNLVDTDDEPIFEYSPKKPCYSILVKNSRKNVPKFSVINGFTYKKNIMRKREINNVEFYCHIKHPNGIWSIKLQQEDGVVIAFPSSDGYYYIDDYYSYQEYVLSKNIPDMLLKRFKIDGVYQCWKNPMEI